jgi:phosphoglycolate phosphatase
VSRSDAVLFDLDGCIVDSLPSIVRCWAETLPDFGLPVPSAEAIRAHVGPPVDVAARSFSRGADEATVAALVAAYRARSVRATDVAPFPGMVDLLAALQAAGMTLGIATSKSLEVVEPLLDRLGLTSRFRVVEGTRRDELGIGKATVVARALARLAPLRPGALVGDRRHDVEGAHANGLAAIGVLWGYGGAAELRDAGADALMATPADLARHLGA